MKRAKTTVCIGVLLIAAVACNDQQAKIESASKTEMWGWPESSEMTVGYMRQQIPVRIAVENGAVTPNNASVYALKSRFNNIYGLAVNTEGVDVATETVRIGDRVFLRSNRAMLAGSGHIGK